MKIKLFFAIAVVFLLAAGIFAQNSESKPAPAANPHFDAELAKKLGADERGMRQYVLAILRTGPAKIEDKVELQKLSQGHFGMINRLAGEGKLVVAGPLNDPKAEYRGIYVFNVKTIEEAEKLTDTDPSIKAGVFKVEFIKWYASAALMDVTNIHNRIRPTK